MIFRTWLGSLTLAGMGFCAVAAADIPPLDHMGAPLPIDPNQPSRITIGHSPYPDRAKGEIISSDRHRCFLDMVIGGAGHTNDTIFFFRSSTGKEIKLEFKPTYWETTNYRWVDEDLLFARIWWGRHWGSDYIFDVDTEKIVYSEGFAEHHLPIKP